MHSVLDRIIVFNAHALAAIGLAVTIGLVSIANFSPIEFYLLECFVI